MTHYSYSSERLPSIAMLNHTYVPCHFSKSLVVSPPLTPLVSPSTSTLHDYKNMPRNKKRPQQRQQHKHVCHFQFCGWSFKRYEHLKRHMLVHTGERPYVCHFPSCGKSFSRSDNFHAHYRTHTKIKNAARKKKSDTRPNVTTGDDPSSSFSLLANHYKPQQQNILTSNCHVASTVAANAAAAVVAVSQQFGSSSVYYNTHLHHHSSSEMIDFTRNNHSNTTFQNYGMLNFDMPKCSSSPPISPVSSAASLSLLNHEISPPDSYQPSPSPNPIYAFPYSVQTDIQYSTTKRSQTSIKSHACPVLQCLRRFKRLEHLKRHMRIHTLERPFACTFPGCQKKFSRSDNLSQHTKTHQKHQEKKRKKKE